LGGIGRDHVQRPVAAAEPIVPFSHVTTSMGGRLVVHLDADVSRSDEARRASAAAVERIESWAGRLTRHSDASELSALNADPRDEVPVGPTLAAVLRAGRTATEQTEGLADITLMDARLAAEGLAVEEARRISRAFDWSMAPGRLGSAIVRRPAGLRFDLGGIGKGWIADRALHLLAEWPSAVIDADGDLAIRCAPGKMWELAVDDPRTPDTTLAVLHLTAPDGFAARWGVATSGVSIHRWTVDGRRRHHLIDPRTGLPAVTDVIQATVIAGSALRAEALAKAAVIAGSVAGFALLERARIRGAVILTERGETLALPQTQSLLGS
jgi:thiamine biosynthesis lipoprotein